MQTEFFAKSHCIVNPVDGLCLVLLWLASRGQRILTVSGHPQDALASLCRSCNGCITFRLGYC